MQNIYGALSAYLMIGVAFAAFFTAIDHLSGGNFFAQGQPDSTQTFQYFSFTTLTTLGYGDFTAAGDFGRALADLEALTGQIPWLPSWPSWSRGSGHPASRNADQPVPEVTSPESMRRAADPSPNPIATEPVTDLLQGPCSPRSQTAARLGRSPLARLSAHTVASEAAIVLRLYPGATASPPASGDPDCGRCLGTHTIGPETEDQVSVLMTCR